MKVLDRCLIDVDPSVPAAWALGADIGLFEETTSIESWPH